MSKVKFAETTKDDGTVIGHHMVKDEDSSATMPYHEVVELIEGAKTAVTEYSVLEEASMLVHGDRQEQYGHPTDCYTPVGRIWGAILGIPDIPPETVVLMLSGMKTGREATHPDRENRVDACGYMETKQMIHNREDAED